ncbi:MAG: hypothetical protein R3D71_08650 [Rickettsiales bacterium]
MVENYQHPAVEGFNPTLEGVKYVGGKLIKGAATGAAVIGFLLLGGGAIVTPIAALVGSVVPTMTAAGAVSAAAGFGGSLTMAAMLPAAGVGAVASGLFALPGIPKAIDERRMDMIADYDQMMVARERHRMMNIARNQQAEYGQGVSAPTVGMGRNLAQNQGVMRG